jgi:uncharacterized membrane protein YidH (DUF202 family)
VKGAAQERTELAWDRTALGPLAAAALLLSKQLGPTLGRVLLVVADVLLALLIIWFGRRRDRRIRSVHTETSGRITVSEGGREVVGAAVAAAAIALATALFIVFET